MLSLGIALATVALGELNAIAPIVSMFFLISYGLLNYATFFEARGAGPSFRPRFRFFNKWLSLLGALGCLAVMLAINPIAGIVALAALLGIRSYLRRSDRPDRWTDATRSYYFQRIRENLFALPAGPAGARNWRPQVLAFSAAPARRARLLEFATWLEGGTGLTAVIEIVVGDGAVKRRERAERDIDIQRQIHELDLDGDHPVLRVWPHQGEHRSVRLAGSGGRGPSRRVYRGSAAGPSPRAQRCQHAQR
jgi:hypothetical protein